MKHVYFFDKKIQMCILYSPLGRSYLKCGALAQWISARKRGFHSWLGANHFPSSFVCVILAYLYDKNGKHHLNIKYFQT